MVFQGVEYPGSHQPLIDAETWQKVQTILTSRRNGERQRLHNHHLKTTAVCGHCGARLLVQNTTARGGDVYRYFVCARRHRLHTCGFSAVLIDQVEQRVADLYRSLALSPQDCQQIAHYLRAELDRIQANSQKDTRALRIRRSQLETERRSLLHAHYAGAVPLELLKEEQGRISRQLNDIECTLKGYHVDAALVRAHLDQALNLMEDCHRLYTAAPDHLKKLLNQVFFSRVLVNPERDEYDAVIFPPDRLNPTAMPPPTAPDAAADDPNSAHDAAPAAIMTKLPLAKDAAETTSAFGLLTPLFDQLASPALRTAARQAHAATHHALHADHAASIRDRETPGTDSDMWEAGTDRETCLADQEPDPERRPSGPSSSGQSSQRKTPASKGRCLELPDSDPKHALHDGGLSRGVVQGVGKVGSGAWLGDELDGAFWLS